MKKLLLPFVIAAMFSTPVFAIEHSKTHTVKMRYNKETGIANYFPDLVRIKPGDTVEWINLGKEFHSITADAGPKGAKLFASPSLGGVGQIWSHTFTDEGTYTYHCRKHIADGMLGTIIVGTAPPLGAIHQRRVEHIHDVGPSNHHGNSIVESDYESELERQKIKRGNSVPKGAHNH